MRSTGRTKSSRPFCSSCCPTSRSRSPRSAPSKPRSPRSWSSRRTAPARFTTLSSAAVSTTGSITRTSRRRWRSCGPARRKQRTDLRAMSQRWCRDSVAWISTRSRGWPRHSTGHDPWPRLERRESTPRWSMLPSVPRSNTKKTWSAFASRSRPWSRRPAVPDLLPRLGAFARLLHDAGLEAGPRRLTDATRALNHIDLRLQADFRSALRAVFVSRKEDLATFEAAFDIFWAPPDPRIAAGALPGRSRALPMSPERAKVWASALGLSSSQMNREQDAHAVPASSSGYSPEELLRHKDFDQMTWQETEQVRRLLEQAAWRVAERRTRRLRPARSGRIDLRRSARHAIRSSGELVRLFHRRPRMRRRPLVLICDVSGSMERYSRLLMIFAFAIARREDLEAFVFSTRLTRITRLLRQRDLDKSLDSVSKGVHDFSGGTRIGEALAEFNRRWARRVLGHGAVVIIVSDGWDRGDPALLQAELIHLRRSAHRLIWLNPLLGSDGYQPLTRGMEAALPHCDDFLAAHNVEALEDLGRLLAGLDRRPARAR